MRMIRLLLPVFVALTLAPPESLRPPSHSTRAAEPGFASSAPERNSGAPQARTPETVPSTPGQWPEQGKHKIVDATRLKSEAQELQTLTQALTPQIDQIGHGMLPKELIGSLKKIEKLVKHMRSEIS